VAADEWVDPRPYCEIIRQWSTAHPEFDWLPRKFKIAITGAREDRAATAVHDIGLKVYRDDDRITRFDVLVGGGLGRTPVVGQVIREGLEVQHLLTYTEAIMRVYNRFGRRDNKYKARIKILVRAMTAEGFRERVDEEWAHLKDGSGALTDEEIARMESHFTPPTYPSARRRRTICPHSASKTRPSAAGWNTTWPPTGRMAMPSSPCPPS
jgi:sulfite reductase (NADPH) hemoprotein beta-component